MIKVIILLTFIIFVVCLVQGVSIYPLSREEMEGFQSISTKRPTNQGGMVFDKSGRKDPVVFDKPKVGKSSERSGEATFGIALLMRKPEDLPLWLKHHRDLGVSKFYVRMEDTPGWEEFLKAQSDIEYEIAESDTTNNYETLQKRQIEFVNKSLRKAEKDGINWLFHIDADELLEGNLAVLLKTTGSLRPDLSTVSPEIKTITMTNVEAVYDGTEKTCFDARRFKRCQEKGANCRSYANGKSAGRVTSKTTLKGPHNFAYDGDHIKYNKQIDFDDLHVLHFDSCSFGAWAEKFRHLNKGTTDKDKTPFPYYEESKKIASSAYETYMKTVGDKETSPDVIHERK